MYAQVFAELASVAVFGAPARHLISEAIEATMTSQAGCRYQSWRSWTAKPAAAIKRAVSAEMWAW